MAYALTGETIKYTGRSTMLLSSASPLSVDDILDIITDTAAEIDAVVMGLEVQVPVDETESPQAFALLKKINAIGAAAMIELRLFGEGTPNNAVNARHTVLLREYRLMLEGLQTGELLLSDAEGGTIGDADLASATSKFDSEGNLVEPFFKRKTQF